MKKFKDLTGRKFGKLTVVRHYSFTKGKHRWECSCDCGGPNTIVEGDALLYRNRTHCTNCTRTRMKDMTGKKYGRLTVTKEHGRDKYGQATWVCECDCGKEIITVGAYLRGGKIKSFGCYQKEMLRTRSITHGKSKTPEYVMFYDACKRSRKRGVPINITPDDIIIPEVCPVLGMPLVAGEGLKSPNTPSLDCIDPAKGYVKGNVIVVSWRYNKFKGDLTPEELRKVANWILR